MSRDRRKVLLVDDANTVVMMVRMMLRDAGYDVVTAASGVEALEAAAREKPDLILLDVVMPEMDGFEACRKLRQRDETKNVPIIMVTTRGESMNVETGFAAGCNEYLTKPFNAVQLLRTVRNHIGEE